MNETFPPGDPHVISVITAAHPSSRPWIGKTGDSLASQSLPGGLRIQWIVQEDGGAAELESFLRESSDSKILDYESNGHQWGTATTRNIASRRAIGHWILALDADDELEPEALHHLVEAIKAEPFAAWACGRTAYLDDDGTTRPYPDRMPVGVVERGWVGSDWLRHMRPAATPCAFLFRRDVFFAYGGWMSLRGSEDTGVLLAISEDWEGRCIDEVVLRYRKWNGSTTADPDWREDHERHQQVVAQRLLSQRRLAEAEFRQR